MSCYVVWRHQAQVAVADVVGDADLEMIGKEHIDIARASCNSTALSVKHACALYDLRIY